MHSNSSPVTSELLDVLYRINGNLYDLRRAAQWILVVVILVAAVLGIWLFADAGIEPDFTPVLD